MPIPSVTRPTLTSIFMGFVGIAMTSFGGGLAAWTRREVVQRRGWLTESQFLSGYALSQLVPGATNVNLAVFIGTQLRGTSGALTAFTGLTALPLAIVLATGWIYFHLSAQAGGSTFSTALSGMGAVAIGLNLGTGIRLARRNITGLTQVALTALVAVSIGIAGLKLPLVLAVMLPMSLLLAWRDSRR